MWTGNQTSYGATVELFRVEVFTDKQCLNLVYTGAVVGGPAWAPRLDGHARPARATALGSPPRRRLPRRRQRVEQLHLRRRQAGAVRAAGAGNADDRSSRRHPGVPRHLGARRDEPTRARAARPARRASACRGNLGPPVVALGCRLAAERLLLDGHARRGGWRGHRHVRLLSGCAQGSDCHSGVGHDRLRRRRHDLDRHGAERRYRRRSRASEGARSRLQPRRRWRTQSATRSSSPAARSSTSTPSCAQDVCAADASQRLGISSEPSLTSAQSPFATGLSSTGRLTSAAHTSTFYGSPLIAWTPAFSADIYEVQYSKKAYPFQPELDPRSKVKGFLTFSTSDVLPLSAGTWWYRVRGIDYNLPTGVQQMGWSDPEKLVVATPKFTIAPTRPRSGSSKSFTASPGRYVGVWAPTSPTPSSSPTPPTH